MRYHSGQICLISGQYAVINAQGHQTGYEVTLVKGATFPPTTRPGYTFALVDRTRHKR